MLAPQTKNVPASTQNTRERLAILRADSAATNGLAAGRACTLSCVLPPSGTSPFSSGRSRIQINTTGTMQMTTTAIVVTAVRHPELTTIRASSGRKTSCPVAELAVSMPSARPRLV